MGRHAVTIAVLVAALAFYGAGWSTGATALLAAGAVLELVFWSRLLHRKNATPRNDGAA